MAGADRDVDMSPPTTPMRISSALSSLTSTPTQKSRMLRFADTAPAPHTRSRSETPYSPGDPFIASDKISSKKISGNITKATEIAFDKERLAIAEREQIAEEYARALDEATSCIQQLGLGKAIGQLEEALSQVIKRFAHGENLLNNDAGRAGLANSIYDRSQGNAKTTKLSYADATKTQLPYKFGANLPPKPSTPALGHSTNARKPDNRIFVRLPEDHPTRDHHVHAIKTALVNKLGLEGPTVKTIQKVKSGLAIVLTDGKHADQLLEKAQTITAIIGGKVEKAEEWFTYVVDHVPRTLTSLDGKSWDVTEEMAREEVQLITGLVPTKLTWSKKTLTNPMPSGTIVAHFKQSTNPFRMFGTSSLARLVTKSPKPTQCPKCWAFHDTRLCNSEQRCNQCSAFGHSSCEKPYRCINCKGPHAANEPRCPARPTVKFGNLIHPTQAHLKRIRQAGHKAWLLANPSPKITENTTSLTQ